jgi:hypothetical protein
MQEYDGDDELLSDATVGVWTPPAAGGAKLVVLSHGSVSQL